MGDQPKPDGVLELLGEMAGVDEQLFRDAAADDAGAAEAVGLGDGDARAHLRGHARRAHAARTRADDEKIEIVLAHGLRSITRTPPSPPRMSVEHRPTNNPCSTTPGIDDSATASVGHVGDGAEGAIVDVVAVVGDVGGVIVGPQRHLDIGMAERMCNLDDAPRRGAVGEGHDLDGQRKARRGSAPA